MNLSKHQIGNFECLDTDIDLVSIQQSSQVSCKMPFFHTLLEPSYHQIDVWLWLSQKLQNLIKN